MKNIAVIIPAAGESTRLGRPKQLLDHNGKTLLAHVTDEALAAGASPVIVVTGANRHSVKNVIAQPARELFNENWRAGMGSGIKAGITFLEMEFESIDAVLLVPCDQPAVSALLFREMIQLFTEKDKIVACKYAETLGTPCLFPKRFFSRLSALPDAEGAKSLLRSLSAEIEILPFAGGEADIDTEEDYRRLQSGSGK